MKILLAIPLIFFTGAAFADLGFEGKIATLIIESKSIARTNEALSLNGILKSSEFSTGLYYEPKNKLVSVTVPEVCRSLVELAFAHGLPLSLRGELKKFRENYTSPNDVSFNEERPLKCELSRSKNQ